MQSLTMSKLAAIAFFALRTKTKSNISSIYSYESSQYYQFSISSQGSIIGVFDYQRGNYLTGNPKGNGWSVFDYSDSQYVDFSYKNNGYSVYDYSSSSYIDIVIRQNSIELYSYANGKYYTFGY